MPNLTPIGPLSGSAYRSPHKSKFGYIGIYCFTETIHTSVKQQHRKSQSSTAVLTLL